MSENVEAPGQFQMSERQRDQVAMQYDRLRAIYMQIGNQICDIADFVITTAIPARHGLSELQEVICKDLGVPRVDRLSWDLNKGLISVVDGPKTQAPDTKD